jgi:hypothetical protein
MVSDRFLRCCECDAIHRVTPFDKAPNHAVIIDGVVQTASDDWHAFTERHGDHKLETLQLTREIHPQSTAVSNPVGVIYLEATNGRTQYLLRRFRNSVEEPFTYHVLAGRVAGGAVALE